MCGQELPGEYFSDDNVGRMLDCLYETGTHGVGEVVCIYIADSAMVTEANLVQAFQVPASCFTRYPCDG